MDKETRPILVLARVVGVWEMSEAPALSALGLPRLARL